MPNYMPIVVQRTTFDEPCGCHALAAAFRLRVYMHFARQGSRKRAATEGKLENYLIKLRGKLNTRAAFVGFRLALDGFCWRWHWHGTYYYQYRSDRDGDMIVCL